MQLRAMDQFLKEMTDSRGVTHSDRSSQRLQLHLTDLVLCSISPIEMSFDRPAELPYSLKFEDDATGKEIRIIYKSSDFFGLGWDNGSVKNIAVSADFETPEEWEKRVGVALTQDALVWWRVPQVCPIWDKTYYGIVKSHIKNCKIPPEVVVMNGPYAPAQDWRPSFCDKEK